MAQRDSDSMFHQKAQGGSLPRPWYELPYLKQEVSLLWLFNEKPLGTAWGIDPKKVNIKYK